MKTAILCLVGAAVMYFVITEIVDVMISNGVLDYWSTLF